MEPSVSCSAVLVMLTAKQVRLAVRGQLQDVFCWNTELKLKAAHVETATEQKRVIPWLAIIPSSLSSGYSFRWTIEGVTGGWRELRIGDLHDLYSLSVIRVIKSRRMGGACSTSRAPWSAFRKLWRKGSLGRPLRIEEDNIKMHFGEVGLEGVDWHGPHSLYTLLIHNDFREIVFKGKHTDKLLVHSIWH
jgi:hypothetical protein